MVAGRKRVPYPAAGKRHLFIKRKSFGLRNVTYKCYEIIRIDYSKSVLSEAFRYVDSIWSKVEYY